MSHGIPIYSFSVGVNIFSWVFHKKVLRALQELRVPGVIRLIENSYFYIMYFHC
jgi:hypothetical protein